jgi:hypothetical protein
VPVFRGAVVNGRVAVMNLLTQDIDLHVIRLFAPSCARQAVFDPIAALR